MKQHSKIVLIDILKRGDVMNELVLDSTLVPSGLSLYASLLSKCNLINEGAHMTSTLPMQNSTKDLVTHLHCFLFEPTMVSICFPSNYRL